MSDKLSAFDILKDYGDLVVRAVPLPSDCNHGGIIFGGSILSQIDVGAGLAAIHHCSGRVVTKAVENVDFKKPIHSHSIVDIYAKLSKIDNTSMTFDISVFATSQTYKHKLSVTACVVFVNIDDNRQPKIISN